MLAKNADADAGRSRRSLQVTAVHSGQLFYWIMWCPKKGNMIFFKGTPATNGIENRHVPYGHHLAWIEGIAGVSGGAGGGGGIYAPPLDLKIAPQKKHLGELKTNAKGYQNKIPLNGITIYPQF
jgi:hypothetical protein